MPDKHLLTRRALARSAAVAGAVSVSRRTAGEPLDPLAQIAADFMASCSVPGLSVAITRHGTILYRQAFGYANPKKREPVTPDSLFRIASVSKPVTSAAVYRLIEAGKLRLNSKVFGPAGLLGVTYGKPPYRPGVEQITVEHLLTHTCGGWDKTHNDPMFHDPELDAHDLIVATIRNRLLDFVPGTHFAYSNFGFCILGRIIEKASGAKCADFVRENIWEACGVPEMRIAGNTLGKRAPLEVFYYDQEGGDPYGMNVTRLDSAGGWLATPAQILQFTTRVDGFAADSNLLKPETIASMTTGSAANSHYAKGWEVNSAGTWWHIGDLPGSSAVLVRAASGHCWAACMNTRRMNPDIRLRLDKMMREMARQIGA